MTDHLRHPDTWFAQFQTATTIEERQRLVDELEAKAKAAVQRRRRPGKRWKHRLLLATVLLDKPGYSIRVHLITWLDDSRCIQAMKYAVQPETGRDVPYVPAQYIQVPLAELPALVEALSSAMPG